jgi:sulfur carrier protein
MIQVNGTPVEAAGKTLQQYLDTTDYNPARIAVERNGEIVPKRLYEETVLRDDDVIEVVSFVGGG